MKKSGQNKTTSNKISASHYVGVVVLVLLVLYFGRGFWNKKKIETPRVGDNLETGKIEGSLKEGTLDDPKWNLSPVDAFSGNGRLEKRVDGDKNKYELFLDLPELVEGKYVGWLANVKDKHYVQLGDVTLGKGGWYLYFETKGDVQLYDQMWVTLEKKHDEIPEKKLLEADLKKVR